MRKQLEGTSLQENPVSSFFGIICEKLGHLSKQELVFAIMLIMIHASATATLGLAMNLDALPYVLVLTCYEISVIWLIPRINQNTRKATNQQGSTEDCNSPVIQGFTFDLIALEVIRPRILRHILNNQGCSTRQIIAAAGIPKGITKKLLGSLNKDELVHARRISGESKTYYINYGKFNEIVIILRKLASLENLLGVDCQWF